MNEAEFAARVSAAQLAVSLHRGSPIGAGLDDGNLLDDAVPMHRVRFERLDDEPLIRINPPSVCPSHASNVPRVGDGSNTAECTTGSEKTD